MTRGTEQSLRHDEFSILITSIFDQFQSDSLVTLAVLPLLVMEMSNLAETGTS
jgi:hypothetical protein